MNRRSAITGLVLGAATLLATASVAVAADPWDASGPALSAADQAALDAKTEMAQDWVALKSGKLSAAAFLAAHSSWADVSLSAAATQAAAQASAASSGVTPMAVSGALGLVQVPQSTNYRCGSATAYEILKYLKVSTGPGSEALSQPNVGKKCATGYLCTEVLSPQETPWYVGSSYPDAGGYPMTSTLNRWKVTTWYATQRGHAKDTTLTEAQYEADLVLDIDNAHPVAIDVYEVANTGYHLVGHPTNRTISHWVAAYGYASSGATTNYADSVHGVSTSVISWAASVPAYSPFASARFFSLFNTYGFVW